MKIATQHICAHEIEKKHIQTGKISRIQEGLLVRLYSNPRTKYEGVHIVIGPCKIQRCGYSHYELIGTSVDYFIEQWFQNILKPIYENMIVTHAKIEQFYDKNKLSLRINDFTKWFRCHSYEYELLKEEQIENEQQGFAVVMTRGPWFHHTKTYMTCGFTLVEFVCI